MGRPTALRQAWAERGGSREVTAGTQVERSFRSNALPGDQEIRCPCDVIRTGWAGGGAADTTRLLTGYANFWRLFRQGTAGLRIAASTNHGTHSLRKLSELGRRERAGRPQDDRLMNGDESVGKSHARPIDAAA